MKLAESAVWTLITSVKLVVMTGSIIVPVINVMRDDLGVDPVSAGLIITTHALFAAFFYPVFGMLINRIGIKKPLVAGLFLYGAAGGSGLFITSYGLLLVSRAVLGIGVAAVLVSITAVLDAYTEEEKHDLVGLRGSSTGFGSINWPVFGGVLGIFSWHLPFAVYLLTIPLGFLTLVTVPELETRKGKEIEKQVKFVAKDGHSIFVMYGFALLTNVLLFTILVFVPQLLEKIGISFPFFISLYIVIIMVSSAFASPLYTRMKNLGYKIAVVTFGLWAVGFATISVGSGLVIAVSVALFGIGQGLITGVVADWINDVVPVSFRDRVNSHLRIFRFTGQFLAPVIFFPVVALSGVNRVFLAAAIICATLFLFIGVLSILNKTHGH